jgi:hypothetical protein|tara:strand:+ start:3627 stop:4472 length:846 start_codon:yes stop_codon:yes gene_type:complete
MNKAIFVADFFANEVPGGGELNNQELIEILRGRDTHVLEVKSGRLTPEFISECPKEVKFIVANFVMLPEESKTMLENDREYIIYEHDHKYVRSRNPADYNNFIAPKSEIINFNFYKNAKAVLCQSRFHADIIKSNLKLDNIISLGGNLWSEDSLETMLSMSKVDKNPTCAIMNSSNWHKNTSDAIRLCEAKQWEYDIIPTCGYMEFLLRLGESEKFVFLPKTPETLSRIVVEARMMGLSVVTNNLVGATGEEWFSLKGEDLVEVIRNKRIEIPDMVVECFK